MPKNAPSKTNIFFSPIIFALLPVVYFLLKDFSLISATDLLPYVLFVTVAVLLFLGINFFIFWNGAAAAVFSVFTWLSLITFGLCVRFFKNSGLILFEQNSELATMALIVLLLLGLYIYLIINPKVATVILDWLNFTAKLIIFLLLGFIGFQLTEEPEDLPKIGPDIPAVLGADTNVSNIYYIILEGFTRLDVLRDGFGVYTQDFEDRLRELGFFIAGNSRANYLDTPSSLASSLNMDYLTSIGEHEQKISTDTNPLRLIIHNSSVFSTLRSRGYHIISLSTGRSEADLVGADIREGVSILKEDLIGFLINNSPVNFLINKFKWFDWEYNNHRDRINNAFDVIPEYLKDKSPKFVFAHIMAPEPPFVFSSKGKAINPKRRMSLKDGSEYAGSKLDYQKKYAAQALYVMNRIVPIIERLAHEDPFATIVIQGDHGSGLQFHWNSDKLGDPQERAAIFNAYRLGSAIPTEVGLNHDISPVNSFRVIFNATFGFNLPILPNMTYFAPSIRPYKYKLIPQATPRILTCRPSLSGRVGRIDPECLEPSPKELGN